MALRLKSAPSPSRTKPTAQLRCKPGCWAVLVLAYDSVISMRKMIFEMRLQSVTICRPGAFLSTVDVQIWMHVEASCYLNISMAWQH